MTPLGRRAVLASFGASALATTAGCAFLGGHPELFLFNRRETPVTVELSLTRLADDVDVFSTTVELAPADSPDWQLSLEPSRHRLVAETADGLRNTLVWAPGDEGCCAEVHVREEAIELGVRAY